MVVGAGATVGVVGAVASVVVVRVFGSRKLKSETSSPAVSSVKEESARPASDSL